MLVPNLYYRPGPAPVIELQAHTTERVLRDADAFTPSALQRHWDRLLPLLDRTLATT